MQPQSRLEPIVAGTDDEPDFASEHSRTSTSDAVCAGADAHSDPDIPLGLGGMDMKRTRLLD
ncbi:hypothetical protein [Catellatospora sp. TT07R-123]|uniref:hypothetical protein n=1 Tax=Catellatospora sp. TT07R-123 TaxID=2733863 RepID=UPI001BB41F49|nr:hypothetical protein [Catellatospora sp. TT07R-123]